MAEKGFYSARVLTGGTTGTLDAIDGADLSDQDAALVVTADDVYVYVLDADSGLAESSPDVIAPDDNAGDKRWILKSLGLPSGSVTDDVVRYNAETNHWERKAEPLELKGVILTPLAEPLSEEEGSIYYNSADDKVYVCRDI